MFEEPFLRGHRALWLAGHRVVWGGLGCAGWGERGWLGAWREAQDVVMLLFRSLGPGLRRKRCRDLRLLLEECVPRTIM